MSKVQDWMTKEVVSAHPDDTLLVADRLMKLRRCRHMPILDDAGKLVGIVSQRDLFFGGIMKALGFAPHEARGVLETMQVSEAMNKAVETIGPNLPLADAAKQMLEKQVGCLVVVDEGGAVCGILTEADFVRMIAS